MQSLRADTLIKVVIGPVVSVSDGYTPITTLNLSTADEAELLKHDASSTTDISANTFAAITGADGYYNLTLSAAQLDTEGMLTIGINDDSLCYPVRHEFMVMNANAYDAFYAAAGTDLLDVNAAEISDDATAADNLESQYDGTGLAGTAYPATQEQVGNLATGSAAISVPAESQLLTTGTEINDYTATEQLDGVYHQISDSAGALELYYQFDVGGNGIAVTVEMIGRLSGPNDSISVWAWDWNTTAWAQIGTLSGSSSSSDGLVSFNLLSKYTGAGSNLGKVRVRGYAASGLTSATLYMDQVYITYSVVAQSAGYASGAVWINTVNGTAGTEPFVNGVADNPVNSLTDAGTLATALNLNQFEISNDSTLTFSATHNSQIFEGQGYTLNLGGQNLDDCHFIGATDINGTATVTSNEIHWTNCEFINATLGHSHFRECGFGGTLTLSDAEHYTFQRCYSQIAGSSAPVFDCGALVGNTELNFRAYSGGIELQNFGATGTDTCTLEGNGQLIINANCTGGTINVRGMFKVTNNSGGAVTVTYDDNSTSIALVNTVLALLDDPRTEPAQGNLPVNPDAMTKIDFIYKFLRNKITSNATTINVYDDSGTTIDHKATHNDDTITYTRDEFVSGP